MDHEALEPSEVSPLKVISSEVIVVGAGPAGLLAAIRSAEAGRDTILLEKNRKLGVKILISGGTRCNVTHDTDRPGIIQGFGTNGKFLHSALSQFGPVQIVELLRAEGVEVKTEPNGKIFPRSDRALDVQQALVRRLERSGCRVYPRCPLLQISKVDGVFQLQAAEWSFSAAKVIMTTGGQSYPGCGTTGDGYAWLAQWGHTIVSPHPALVPLRSDAAWVAGLSGIALPDAQVWVVEPHWLATATDWQSRLAIIKKRHLQQRRAPLLFTHLGLSGPAAMDVSKAISTWEQPDPLVCAIDLIPACDADGLAQRFEVAGRRQGGRGLARWLQHEVLTEQEIPQRLLETVLEICGIDPRQPAAELGRTQRGRIIEQLKSLAVPITETLGYNKAEVTTGGVHLKEINPRTMESKLVPGLYVAGELLDLDGWIGGYNFQSAFSTGWVAGGVG